MKEEKQILQMEINQLKKKFDEEFKTILKGKKEAERTKKMVEIANIDLQRQKMILKYENKRLEKRKNQLGK